MDYSVFQIKVFVKDFNNHLWQETVRQLNTFDMNCKLIHHSTDNTTSLFRFSFNFLGNKAVLLNNETFSTTIHFNIQNFNPKNSFTGHYALIARELKGANYELTFGWNPSDLFSLRFVLLISAIVAEKFNGICYYPLAGIWRRSTNIMNTAFAEVISFEKIILSEMLGDKYATGKNNDIISPHKDFENKIGMN